MNDQRRAQGQGRLGWGDARLAGAVALFRHGRVGGEVAVRVPEHLMIESNAESNERRWQQIASACDAKDGLKQGFALDCRPWYRISATDTLSTHVHHSSHQRSRGGAGGDEGCQARRSCVALIFTRAAPDINDQLVLVKREVHQRELLPGAGEGMCVWAGGVGW
jgi:hypothetical protein